jgi:hypothetical protein
MNKTKPIAKVIHFHLLNGVVSRIFEYMVKKFFISSLIFIFILSTVGLPLLLHICEISGSKTVISCSDCKEVTATEPTTSCCKEEKLLPTRRDNSPIKDGSAAIYSDKSSCCSDEMEQIKIDDEFSASSSQKFDCDIEVTIISVVSELNLNENSILRDTENLPPPLFGKILLNTLHQLKIDTLLS